MGRKTVALFLLLLTLSGCAGQANPMARLEEIVVAVTQPLEGDLTAEGLTADSPPASCARRPVAEVQDDLVWVMQNLTYDTLFTPTGADDESSGLALRGIDGGVFAQGTLTGCIDLLRLVTDGKTQVTVDFALQAGEWPTVSLLLLSRGTMVQLATASSRGSHTFTPADEITWVCLLGQFEGSALVTVTGGEKLMLGIPKRNGQ